MKRLIVCLSLSALLAFPTAAMAKVITFTGLGKDDLAVSIRFDVKKKDGEFQKVRDVFIRNALFHCTPTFSLRRDAFIDDSGVVHGDGEFKLKTSSPNTDYVFKGDVRERKNKNDKAKGFYKLAEGEVSPDCETGRVDWEAFSDESADN